MLGLHDRLSGKFIQFFFDWGVGIGRNLSMMIPNIGDLIDMIAIGWFDHLPWVKRIFIRVLLSLHDFPLRTS